MDPLHPAVPSFGLDVELAPRFPQEIDGVPVTDLTTVRWIDYLCTLGGGQAAVDLYVANMPPSLNSTTFTHGYADAVVEGDEVDLAAYRTPGQDANVMIQSFAQLAHALFGTDLQVTVSTATIGGKNVSVLTDENGGVGYAYASGDTLFIVSSVTDSQAAKIFAAFP